jgi:hypothetical protein
MNRTKIIVLSQMEVNYIAQNSEQHKINFEEIMKIGRNHSTIKIM